jgi:hypothetical protein
MLIRSLGQVSALASSLSRVRWFGDSPLRVSVICGSRLFYSLKIAYSQFIGRGDLTGGSADWEKSPMAEHQVWLVGQ